MHVRLPITKDDDQVSSIRRLLRHDDSERAIEENNDDDVVEFIVKKDVIDDGVIENGESAVPLWLQQLLVLLWLFLLCSMTR